MNRKEAIERRAWVVIGPQGSGRSIAQQIAGTYAGLRVTVSWTDITTDFIRGRVLDQQPSVVIVDEVPAYPTKKDLALLKTLATEQQLLVERKGKECRLIAAPVFIFVLEPGTESRYYIDSRHFRVVLT